MSNQNKNIFDFFRKQYEEKSNQDQGWNAPPDFIFEDALSVVNSKKAKKKRFLLLFLLAGLLVSSIVVTNLYFSSKINTIEQKVQNLSGELSSETIVPEINKLSKNNVATTTATNESQQKEETLTISNEKLKATNTITKASTNTLIASNNTKLTTTKQKRNKPSTSISVTQTKRPIVETKSSGPNLASKDIIPTRSTLSALVLLSSRNISSLTYNKKEHLIDGVLTMPTNHSSSSAPIASRVALTLVAKYNYSSLKMDGPGATAQSLTLYDKYYSGYGTQLNAQIPVTKNISLLSSLSYDKMKNRSLLNYTMFYDDANHINMSGNMMMYSQDSDLSTPMGELEDRMRFEVDPSAYANGTAINQYANILQSMTVLGLHLGPQVDWINCNKLKWSSALQFGVNYVNKMLTSVSSEYVIMNSTMSTSESEFSSMDSMKKLSTSLSLSTYLSYELNNNYSITGGISTMKSLSSLRSQTPPSTKLINWSTQIGITRTF